jgi:hypothetical protein
VAAAHRDDPPAPDRLDRLAAIPSAPPLLLAAGLALAWLASRGHGLFQSDEYFQVVEAASYLLGRTAFSDLAWEFPARIRPFTQPAAYAALARAGSALGLTDPFSLLWLFRAATALFSWAALVALYRAVAPGLRGARARVLLAATLGLGYFAPYLAARTSSENVSAGLLLLALALRLRPARGAGWGTALLTGVVLGLAFDVRYQAAFAGVGIFAHAALQAPGGEPRWRAPLAMVAGAALAFGAGLAVDAWAYGAPVLTPWNYLRVNLLEGKAAEFGTLPVIAYPVLLAGAFPPYGAFAVAGLGLLWIRRPRHLLTWATVPFVVGHSLVAHKEVRFLLPMLVPALVGLVILWDDQGAAEGRGARLLGWLRRAFLHPVTLAMNGLGLLLVCTLPPSDNLEVQRWFRQHAHDPVAFCALSDPARHHGLVTPFLWPDPPVPVTQVADLAGLQACWAGASAPVVVLAKYPLAPEVRAYLDASGEVVFTSLPQVVERLDVKRWVARADLYYAWRLRPAAAAP